MANIGNFNCSIENCLSDYDGSLVLSLRIPEAESGVARQIVDKIKTSQHSANKRLKTQMYWERETRGLNANAYFHVLVDKIAKTLNSSAEEVKIKMVLEYGAIATENGDEIIVAIPKSANVFDYYKYAKWMGDFTAKNGKPYSQYLLYKQTHTLDCSEMAQLIDGVVQEAKGLGIETRTPDEIARLIALWDTDPEKNKKSKGEQYE